MGKNIQTFAERGVYVGFRTRLVEFMRCRFPRDPEFDDFEALLPNWVKGGEFSRSSDLVMPFRDVPAWADLDHRDKSIHEKLAKRRFVLNGHLDPLIVREVRLEVDMEQGSDFERATARKELDAAESDTQNAYLEILVMFGREYGRLEGHQELMSLTRPVLVHLAEYDPSDLERLVRIIAGTVSHHGNIARDVLQQRLDTLSEYSSPICSLVTDDPTRAVGYLSRQCRVLEKLRDEIDEYTRENTEEFRNVGQIIIENINTFMDYAMTKARGIKNALLDDRQYLNEKRYKRLLDTVLEERVKISFALDGWSSHYTKWALARSSDIKVRNAILSHILREMPVPTQEIEESAAGLVDGHALMSLRGRLVKELHSWLDDRIVTDLYKRVRTTRNDTELFTDALVAGRSVRKIESQLRTAISEGE